MVGTRNRRSYVRNSPNYRSRSRQKNLYPSLPKGTYSDSDGDNISYESDHSEYDDDDGRNANNSLNLTGSEQVQNHFSWLTMVLIFVAVVIVIYITRSYWRANSNNGNILLKRYKQQINSILRRNFTVEYEYGTNTKAILWLIGEKWIYQKHVDIFVILIAGAKADMLADAVGDVFSNVTGKGEIDRIFCNEYKDRYLLENEVRTSLSKYSKSVVLHGIDRLRGLAPLYLHSLSDPDHSPFPSALILLTINLFFGSHPNCEDAITNYLINVWDSNYISEEQIRPILSRISPFLICLED